MADSSTVTIRSAWRRLMNLLKPETADIGRIYLYALLSGFVSLALPLGIQAITSFTMMGQLSSSWTILLIIIIFAVLLTGILQIFQMSLSESIQQRLFTRAAFEFSFRITRFRKDIIKKEYPPELINRFFDVFSIQKGLAKILIDLSSSSLHILFGLILLSFYHSFFVFFGIFLVFFLAIMFRWLGPAGLRTSLEESHYKYELVHWLEELARTMDTFKIAGRTNLPLGKTNELSTNYLKSRNEHFKVLVYHYSLIILFKTLVIAGLLAAGSILVINNELNMGQFIASEILIILVINSVEKLILSLEAVYDVLTSLEKIAHVTDLPLEELDGLKADPYVENGPVSISFENVRLEDEGDTLLQDISFTIAPGEKVCITGEGGSGRSALLGLAAATRFDFSGNISYNDIPLENYNTESLRSYIGDSLSDEDLFTGTLMENVSMGRTGLREEHVLQAAEKTGLTTFVKSLRKGWLTEVLASGKGFADSIKKKIILTRSIADNPRLLVLDDPIKELDPRERKRLKDLLFSGSAPWTLIVATRATDLVEKCDKVIVLESGRVIWVGPYDEMTAEQKRKYFF